MFDTHSLFDDHGHKDTSDPAEIRLAQNVRSSMI